MIHHTPTSFWTGVWISEGEFHSECFKKIRLKETFVYRCRSPAFLALADIRARHTTICDNHLNSACGFSAVKMPFQHLRILPLVSLRLLQSEWVLRQTAKVWCSAFWKHSSVPAGSTANPAQPQALAEALLRKSTNPTWQHLLLSLTASECWKPETKQKNKHFLLFRLFDHIVLDGTENKNHSAFHGNATLFVRIFSGVAWCGKTEVNYFGMTTETGASYFSCTTASVRWLQCQPC